MTDELPKGWAWAKIADITEDLQAGFASGEKAVDGGISQLRMNNIGINGSLVLDLVRSVPEALAKENHILIPGDVLVCTTNSGKLVGKCAYFNLPGRFTFSNHLTRLRFNPSLVDGQLLSWVLWSLWKSGAYEEKTKHWVNQSAIPNEALLGLEIPIAPRAEQPRIVKKLEKLLAEIEQCKERMAKIPVLLKHFRQSVLAAACSGRLTADWREQRSIEKENADNGDNLPLGWKPVALGGVIEDLRYGTSAKCSIQPNGTAVLRIPNIGNGVVDHSELKYARLPGTELKKLALVPGDILMIRSNGSVSLVGKTAVVGDRERGFAYAGYLIRLRAKPNIILPLFLHFCFANNDVRQQIEIPARSTSGVNNINSREVRQLHLLLPPIEEQEEIIRRATKYLALADRIEERYRGAKKHVDSLTQSILAKAFRGELVPTEAEFAAREDRSFESAEELLARIKRLDAVVEQRASKRFSGSGRKRQPRLTRKTRGAS